MTKIPNTADRQRHLHERRDENWGCKSNQDISERSLQQVFAQGLFQHSVAEKAYESLRANMQITG